MLFLPACLPLSHSVHDTLNPPDDDDEDGDDLRDDRLSVHSPQMSLEMEEDDDNNEHAAVTAQAQSSGVQRGSVGGTRPESPSYWESPVGKSRGKDVPENPPPLDFRPLQWSAADTTTPSATQAGEHENQQYPAGSALQVARNNKKM